MKAIVHKFLTYAPAGIVGLVIAAAGVWDALRDKIAMSAGAAVSAMRHPGIAVAAGIFVAAYVAAIFVTNDDGEGAAEARAAAKAQKARARGFLITVGRSLANGFIKTTDPSTLLEFMQRDGGYARIRPHLSKKFLTKLETDDPDKRVMADALLDEMDRLERKWRLV